VSSSPPLRLFYFRHGETAWSLSGQHTGVTDIPLTPYGETQARALRPWAAAISFAHVLTSPRLRARVTCELAGLGAAAIVEPDLAEWNYGDYEGRRSADILEGRPGWNIFRDGCPNGESPAEIGARADRLTRACASSPATSRCSRMDNWAAYSSRGGSASRRSRAGISRSAPPRWAFCRGIATIRKSPSSRSGMRRRAFRRRAAPTPSVAKRERPDCSSRRCQSRVRSPPRCRFADTASGSAPRPGRDRGCSRDRR